MKYENRDTFEAVNMFGTGVANTAFSRYFIGDSFLNPLTNPKDGLFAANVTFEPGCRNNWHIHHAATEWTELIGMRSRAKTGLRVIRRNNKKIGLQ